MIRLFLIFCVLFNLCFSIERPKLEDFVAGYERNKASILNYEGMPAFALSENLLAVLKQNNSKLNKYVKYDPFLNLYLVRTDFSLIPTPMGDEEKLTRNDWIGIWDPYKAYMGHIKYLAQDINEKDQLDFNSKIGLLGTPCCEMMGIALNNSSFIGNRYLKHFMKYNDVYWGDIGVDFVSRDNKIYVGRVRKNPQFLINDQIIGVDGSNINDLRKLNEKILFSDRGSTLYFKVLRDNMDLNISTEVFAKDLSQFKIVKSTPKAKITNFKSYLGLTLNNSFIVIKIDADSKAAKAGFMIGDKILRVNNIILNNLKQLENILSTGNDFNVLIQRKSNKLPLSNFNNALDQNNNSSADGNFQFFIRLTK